MVEKGLRQSHMAVVTSAFSKSSVFAVHTNTLSRRFQIYPLWRASSKSSVFRRRKRRFSVDGRPIRIKKVVRLSVDVALFALCQCRVHLLSASGASQDSEVRVFLHCTELIIYFEYTNTRQQQLSFLRREFIFK